jgi:chorismate mutase
MPEADAMTLDALRQEIDRIDGEIHKLLLARAEVVTNVAAAKANASDGSPAPAFRAAREAEVLRQLVARHRGPLKLRSLVRIWREIMSGMTEIQQQIVVAVHVPETADKTGWDIARDHFGLGMRYLPLRSSREVVAAVNDGRAGIGVLSAPDAGSDGDPWWPLLAAVSEEMPKIVMKLPFLLSKESVTTNSKVAICMPGPEPEISDVAYVVIETVPGISREKVASTLRAAGIEPKVLHSDPKTSFYLAEMETTSTDAVDRRVIKNIVSIGGYPTQIVTE